MDEKVIARFWAKVNKSGPVPPHVPELGECWEWTAHRAPTGYGMLNLGGRTGRPRGAHVVSWVITNGGDWPSLCVCHRCDNRACVRPDHLFLGTRAENNADKVAKGRAGAPRLAGERHGMSKVTEADVAEMRAMHRSGVRQSAIAERFGIHQTNVSLIVRRKAWAHLA